MPTKVYAIIFGLVVIAAGCKSNDTITPANSASAPAAASPATNGSPSASPSSTATVSVAKSKIDSCKLLTSDDLKAVQGEPLKGALRSDRENGRLTISQCYYSLPTASNSVVLNITTPGEGSDERSAKTF
ncbi:MAG TPA: hypothetical protein VHD88_02540 [Pyrinomonadaceae bacterium]|nr:hypothetical protein [Pyrinomonadaceae bacterium]